MTGILSGMVVAFKQIKPEQEISLSSIGLRVKVGLDLKVQGIGIRSNKETCLFICSVLHLLKKCVRYSILVTKPYKDAFVTCLWKIQPQPKPIRKIM